MQLKQLLTFALLCIFSTSVYSFDRLWLNEVNSSLYPVSYKTEKSTSKAKKVLGQEYVSNQYQADKTLVLHELDYYIDNGASCDFIFIKKIKTLLSNNKLSDKKIKQFFKLLALEREIDSVLLELIIQNIELDKELKSINTKIKNSKRFSDENILNMFSEVDAKDLCSKIDHIKEIYFNSQKKKIKKRHLLKYARTAAFKEIISKESYKLIKALDESEVLINSLNIHTYTKSFETTRDSFVEQRADAINEFSEHMEQEYPEGVPVECRVKRPQRLGPVLLDNDHLEKNTKSFLLRKSNSTTKRSNLYHRFTSEQIRLMADVIYKAGRRMEADCMHILIDYNVFKVGDEEPLVLLPQDKYNLSLRLLKRDFKRLKDQFELSGVELEYADIVIASYEVGLIHLSELDQVIKFEEFWNKKQPEWKRWASFATSIGASASLALPPPFNFLAASGLTLINSVFFKPKVDKKKEDNNEALF